MTVASDVAALLKELDESGVRPDREFEFDNGDVSRYFLSGRRYVWISFNNDASVVLYSDRVAGEVAF